MNMNDNEVVVNILNNEQMIDLLKAIEREGEQIEKGYNNITFEEVDNEAIKIEEVYNNKLAYLKRIKKE